MRLKKQLFLPVGPEVIVELVGKYIYRFVAEIWTRRLILVSLA